jgi:hypothetical protein
MLLHVQVQIFVCSSLKSLCGCSQFVIANLDWRKSVGPAPIRFHLQHEPGVNTSERHLGVRQNSAGAVQHNSGDGPLVSLSSALSYEEEKAAKARHNPTGPRS